MARKVEEEYEEDEGESIERVFEGQEVPDWKEQVTARALAVSALLGFMFSVIVMKLNLTTGIIPSLNVSAGLLGFFLLTSWTRLLDKAGVPGVKPFTRQENTVVQTCVVACSGIAFSGTHTHSHTPHLSLFLSARSILHWMMDRTSMHDCQIDACIHKLFRRNIAIGLSNCTLLSVDVRACIDRERCALRSHYTSAHRPFLLCPARRVSNLFSRTRLTWQGDLGATCSA